MHQGLQYLPSRPQDKTSLVPNHQTWVPQDLTNAAHLFAYMHGQEVNGFGVWGYGESRIIFALNGMIVSQLVEKKFDKGFIAIVPRLPDYPTQSQIAAWNLSEPKEYKIRILDPKSPEVDEVVRPDTDLTWKGLDGTPVEFKSASRPRARYLYFHYYMQILRRAWRAERKAGEQMKREFGKGYWGTIGPYLPRSMLRAFIEELGHGYEELLKGGEDDKATSNQVDGDLVVVVASS